MTNQTYYAVPAKLLWISLLWERRIANDLVQVDGYSPVLQTSLRSLVYASTVGSPPFLSISPGMLSIPVDFLLAIAASTSDFRIG